MGRSYERVLPSGETPTAPPVGTEKDGENSAPSGPLKLSSDREALDLIEPGEGKLSRRVPRGPGVSNGPLGYPTRERVPERRR